ncbi:MAG: hypothetical protein V2I48_06880 [Xanthomonadales bacterium]|nr:hypothetical protein [Xanthomonadales bacterium]
MSMFSHFKAAPLFLALMATLALSACATTSTATPEPVAEPEPVVEIEPWDGDGMEIPMDGSSMQAWNRSLARVEAYSDEKTFITLENAIDYLLVYDLASYKDMNKLIKRLDGLTGYQILERVNWRKPAPGKGPAEKGAADAKIIDS